MSRTASCFFALGMCVAIAAACGDDDGGDGGGGSGGQGASGGSGGSGGNGGSSGSAGSGNQAGSAGMPNGGNGGTAGTTGGTAGTGNGGNAGSGAGTGPIVEPPDAGPDGSVVDSGTDVPDSGGGSSGPADSGVNGDCAGFTTGLTTLDPQNSQDVVIARVIFNDDGETATAVLRVINAFSFGGDQVLCWGATNSECAPVDDGIIGTPSPVGAEIFVEVGSSADPIEVADGELFFAAANPETDTPQDPLTVFAYVNWGDHTSADVDAGGPIPTLEGMADAAGFWTIGESVDLDGDDNAFFGLGDTSLGSGFDGCTADQF